MAGKLRKSDSKAPKRALDRRGGIDSYFPRLSTSSTPPEGPQQNARATTAKSDRPSRTDQDAGVVSSSSSSSAQSYIVVPSDSVAHFPISSVTASPDPNRRTRPPAASSAKSVMTSFKKAAKTPSVATASPKTRSSASHQPLSAVKSPQRQLRQDASKVKSSIKRKYHLEGDSDAEPSHEPNNALSPASQAPNPLPPSSNRIRPLGPKDNVPVTRSRADSIRKPSSPKKARLSSQEPTMAPPSSGHDADVEELIPSSQSDEHELAVPRCVGKNPADVKESVDKWRQDALAHPPSPMPTTVLPDDNSTTLPEISFPDATECMDVDDDVGQPSALPVDKANSAPHSETEVSMMLRGRSSVSTLASVRHAVASSTLSVPASPAPAVGTFRPTTPPATNQPAPHPSTPVALDTESKTRKIIAEIKAQVYAAATSSPEEDVQPEFQELEDSSSSDSDDGFLHFQADKGKGKAVATPVSKAHGPFSSPLSNLSDSQPSRHRSSRYDLRHRSPVESASSPEEKKRSFYAKPSAKANAKRRATDPLEALLKEKKLADKRGNGMSALRAAEAAVASSSQQLKRELMSEMDDEEDSENDAAWADEDAALQIVQRGARGLDMRSSSPVPTTTHASEESDDDSESDEEDLQEADCEKILGEKGGKAVGKILASDRRSNVTKAKGKRKERVIGVSLWEDLDAVADKTGDHMQTDTIMSLPLKADLDGHSIISALRDAMERADESLVVRILGSGCLSLLEPRQSVAVTPWLYNLAMASVETPLSDPAYQELLQQFTSQAVANADSGVSFGLVLSTIVRLGAKTNILEAQNWKLENGEPESVAFTRRGEILHRLVTIIQVCAQRNAIPIKDISDIMLVLLLVALDPSTSSELQRVITVTIDYLGRAIPSDAGDPSETEGAVCSRISEFAKELTPINKAHLMSFMMGGCSQTERMARWIARSLLLGTSSAEPYSSLPSLGSIVTLLSPAPSSEAIFDIPGNSDKDDYYEDLTCYVTILSMALTDIDGYVAEEKAAPRAAEGTPTKDATPKEKPPQLLEQIRTLLDGLHGKIVDTRAAHLDRSRAKAALQRLSFRVHYQRLAALRSGGGTGKPRNLRSYFASPGK
ncbi:hypothetical protein B0H21DRAFT_106737 [Amylocystis lapponica]|nr:hypothetical protein B0H21DRAFT_106737 [Amylocystis lapponica]